LFFVYKVATIATYNLGGIEMQLVGIKELKNKLTYYLGITKKGDRVIVTERGVPIAVLHNLDSIEEHLSIEEKLASLAKQGKIRLPLKKDRPIPFKPIKVKGKPLSETILEERR
jgi:prevent-host-death family protein